MTNPPILILKKGTATKADIALMRKAGVAVLEVASPGDVRYMDPPLSAVSGIEALCFTMVDNAIAKDSSLYPSAIKERIVGLVMSDCRGKKPLPVSP